MRKPTDDIFQLIKAMTKGEKLVFKQLAARHIKKDKTNYIKLYELIEKESSYNEQAVKVKAEKKLNTQYFSHDKNNLYQLIKQALFFFHTGRTAESEALEHYMSARIMLSKNLAESAWKEIRKAKNIAVVEEMPLIEILCSFLERQLIIQTPTVEGLTNQLTLIDREEALSSNIDNHRAYKKISARLWLLRYKYSDSHPKIKKFVSGALQNPLLKNPKNATTFVAKNSLYEIMWIIHSVDRNYRKMAAYSQKIVNLYEEKPLTELRRVKALIYALCNVIQDLSWYAKLKDVEAVVRKVTYLLNNPKPKVLANNKVKPKVLCYAAITNSMIRNNDFNKVDEYSREIDKTLKKSESLIGSLNVFEISNNLSYCFFAKQEYHRALYWINNILNNKELDSFRGDYHFLARTLNILIHYELRNFDSIEYLIQSAIRFLKSKNEYNELEKTTFRYLQKLQDSYHDKSSRTFLNNFRIAINSIRNINSKEGEPRRSYQVLERWIKLKTESLGNPTL